MVISIVMASSLIQTDSSGRLLDCRLAVGSCSAVAKRLRQLESELVGCHITDGLSHRLSASHFTELSAIDDVRADDAYRMHAALTAAKSLLDAAEIASGEPV